MGNKCCSAVLWCLGVACFIVGVVFDWVNFVELRENDEEIETTGNKACDFALNEYHWIFMTSVICKMVSGLLEYFFGSIALCTGGSDNIYDTLSLLFSVITTLFQAADLLLLVLFSYECLRPERSHHVDLWISDEKDDFVASFFGTAGVVFNLTIKRNILTIFKALCSPCCSEKAGGCHKFLSFLSMVLILVCVGLAIALLRKIV